MQLNRRQHPSEHQHKMRLYDDLEHCLMSPYWTVERLEKLLAANQMTTGEDHVRIEQAILAAIERSKVIQ